MGDCGPDGSHGAGQRTGEQHGHPYRIQVGLSVQSVRYLRERPHHHFLPGLLIGQFPRQSPHRHSGTQIQLLGGVWVLHGGFFPVCHDQPRLPVHYNGIDLCGDRTALHHQLSRQGGYFLVHGP